MQPKSTNNLLSFDTYLVGPDKVIILESSQGREFMYADRFHIEFIIEVSQTVDPRVEHEMEAAKIIEMFTTELKVRARI